MNEAADDFDALFDEVSAQRASPAMPPAAPAAGAEDDLEALFDQVAAGHRVQQAPEAAPGPDGAGSDHAEAGASADKPMFERLGGIVRLLHDSLRELGYDKALTEASSQIVHAQDRLEYVASLTEQAANKVLNTLDDGMPAQDALSKNARQMDARWSDLFDGKLSVDQFKTLAGDSRQFAQDVAAASEAEKARLLEIMMAQDFQDITGQLIKKVVAITKTVEHELADLLRDNAPPEVREKFMAKPAALMSGPSMPSVALDQDNVDDLLADLGF
ncbi:MAG: protein phosphatase CheZ [Telluria sp.]|nr:protein phosphatase CheZ [Telluria sp.]